MFTNLRDHFYFEPDTGAAAASPAAPAPAATPEPSPAPSATPSAPASPAPAATASAAAGSASVPVAQPVTPSWLEGLRTAGLPVGKDETETIAELRRIYEERQYLESVRPLVPVLSQWQQHASAFSQWQQEQAKANQPAKAEGDPWWKPLWNAPEYNPAWQSQVRQDANGNLVPAPGAPADVVLKLQQHQQYQQEQAQKFLQNPFQYLEPAIDQRAKMVAEQMISSRLQEMQDRQAAGQFVQQNQNWLYELDANGQPKMQPVLNPQTGQLQTIKALSPWGKRYTEYLQEASGLGLPTLDAQQKYANALIQRDAAQAAAGQPAQGAPGGSPAPAAAAPAKTPQQLANEKFLAGANPAAATAGRSAAPADVKVTRKNIHQIMKASMDAGGITDQTLANARN
jgi:hypothetical protein